MKIGVTGHQERDGIRWGWVRSAVGAEFARRKVEIAYSSLAIGTDQVFAEVALQKNAALVAVIPFDNYKKQFNSTALQAYTNLLERCSDVVTLRCLGSPELAYLNAGKWIANASDIMFAVWDGKEAEGMGGTADIVSFAKSIGKSVVHFDPVLETVKIIRATG